MGYSREDIIRMVKEEDVKFIRMQFIIHSIITRNL